MCCWPSICVWLGPKQLRLHLEHFMSGRQHGLSIRDLRFIFPLTWELKQRYGRISGGEKNGRSSMRELELTARIRLVMSWIFHGVMVLVLDSVWRLVSHRMLGGIVWNLVVHVPYCSRWSNSHMQSYIGQVQQIGFLSYFSSYLAFQKPWLIYHARSNSAHQSLAHSGISGRYKKRWE